MTKPKTIFDKIWEQHSIRVDNNGKTLLFVGRHFVTDAAQICFDNLSSRGRDISKPAQTVIITDHTAPVWKDRPAPVEEEIRIAIDQLSSQARKDGAGFIGFDHPDRGIVHVVGPQLGLTLPGIIIACDDSHTTTHGALGALALGVGISESTHILATQSLWQPRYKQTRIELTGQLDAYSTAKDVALLFINEIGASGAVGHLVEFAGDVVRQFTIEQRMTLCNMAVEAGARAAIVAPDEATFDYLESRRYSPKGDAWRQAVAYWRTLYSDPGADFERVIAISVDRLVPRVTWGNSPEESIPIDGLIPSAADEPDPTRKRRIAAALAYMGLEEGTPIRGIPIDFVFIGSCTNARITDLRAAASVVRGRTACVPAIVVPGSRAIKEQAEAEGLAEIFTQAGFQWLDAGCSMCCGMNGDHLAPGTRAVSTANRNFVGRQGPGTRTHLMSPAMAAAAAVAGCITDWRAI